MPDTTITSDAPTTKTGVSSGVRIAIAVLVAITLGIFMILWDGFILPRHGIPGWCGPFIILPLLATILGFGGDCLIQQLSCGQVQWLVQLNRVSIVPVPFILTWAILYFIPNLRWPIEGLIQSQSPALKAGLSSGFYAFWIGMYCQSLLSGLSQICPK